MDLQDRFATILRRPIDRDMTVEPARSQQRLVKNIRTVGRRQHDHRIGPIEAVHFAENLVERLFPLVMAASEPRSTHSTDRVDFINEDNAGGLVSRGPEQVTNPSGSDTDEHLDELGAVDRKERNTGLTGSRP